MSPVFVAFAVAGELPPAVGRSWIAFLPAAVLTSGDRGAAPPPAGRVRRLHEGAHSHRGTWAQRKVGRHRLQHHSHTHFHGSRGLHGARAVAGTDIILTRGIVPANTGWLRERIGRNERQRPGHANGNSNRDSNGNRDGNRNGNGNGNRNGNGNGNRDGNGNGVGGPGPVGQPCPHRRSRDRWRGHGPIPARPDLRARRAGGAGRRREHRLPPQAHPETAALSRSCCQDCQLRIWHETTGWSIP